MSQAVSIAYQGQIAVITIDSPPVNALSQAVRSGLVECVAEAVSNKDTLAIVLICAGRTFIAGADISEFGKPPLKPFLPDVLEILDAGIELKAMVHITGGGLSNLNRVQKDNIRFVIDPLPDVLPVFSLIQERGGISDSEMYEVFNMGVGFCVVVESANAADRVHAICKQHNISCHGIGHVETAQGKEVLIPSKKIKAVGHKFSSAK